MAASSPLSLPEEMWRSLVPIEMLSLRELGLRTDISFGKYPSVTLPGGGEAGIGLARELAPLALLELFLLLPLRRRAR